MFKRDFLNNFHIDSEGTLLIDQKYLRFFRWLRNIEKINDNFYKVTGIPPVKKCIPVVHRNTNKRGLILLTLDNRAISLTEEFNSTSIIKRTQEDNTPIRDIFNLCDTSLNNNYQQFALDEGNNLRLIAHMVGTGPPYSLWGTIIGKVRLITTYQELRDNNWIAYFIIITEDNRLITYDGVSDEVIPIRLGSRVREYRQPIYQQLQLDLQVERLSENALLTSEGKIYMIKEVASSPKLDLITKIDYQVKDFNCRIGVIRTIDIHGTLRIYQDNQMKVVEGQYDRFILYENDPYIETVNDKILTINNFRDVDMPYRLI